MKAFKQKKNKEFHFRRINLAAGYTKDKNGDIRRELRTPVGELLN